MVLKPRQRPQWCADRVMLTVFVCLGVLIVLQVVRVHRVDSTPVAQWCGDILRHVRGTFVHRTMYLAYTPIKGLMYDMHALDSIALRTSGQPLTYVDPLPSAGPNRDGSGGDSLVSLLGLCAQQVIRPYKSWSDNVAANILHGQLLLVMLFGLLVLIDRKAQEAGVESPDIARLGWFIVVTTVLALIISSVFFFLDAMRGGDRVKRKFRRRSVTDHNNAELAAAAARF